MNIKLQRIIIYWKREINQIEIRYISTFTLYNTLLLPLLETLNIHHEQKFHDDKFADLIIFVENGKIKWQNYCINDKTMKFLTFCIMQKCNKEKKNNGVDIHLHGNKYIANLQTIVLT